MSEPAEAPNVLLELAAADEFAARSLLPIAGITDGVLGFHAQQAVEKALKAVLAINGVDFPYSHDLDGLIKLCRKSDIDPRRFGWGRSSVGVCRQAALRRESGGPP